MTQQKIRKKAKNKPNKIRTLRKSSKGGLYLQDNKELLQIYKALNRCSFSYLLQKCFTCLTEFITRMFCGREYCNNPLCQELTHKRRLGRKWLRFLKLGETIGYWGFPLPKRNWTQEELKKVRNYIKNMLKNHLDKGLLALVRWHWFGDGFFTCNYSKKCNYKGISKRLKNTIICNNFYTNCKYKEKVKNPYFPHLNILSNTEYIPDDVLEKIKKLYRRWLYRTFNVGLKNAIVWYKYSNVPQLKMHWFTYIFRNTFRILEGNEELAISLMNFRNDVAWGNFEDISYEIPEEYSEFQKEIISKDLLKLWKGKCPECGSRNIKTAKGLIYEYDLSGWEHIQFQIYKLVLQKRLELLERI